jgi:signal transduction histidine kinase/ActR/RegA family two-component response regulator
LPSVSRSLQVMAIAVALLIIAVTAQQLLRVRTSTIDNAENQMARLDMVFAEQTGRAAETVDFILRNAIDAVKQLPPGTQPHAAVMDDLLHHWVEGVRQVRGVCVTDSSGTIIYASGPPMQGDVPRVLHEAVVWHAAHPDGGLQISGPLRETDGVWTALMTRRINAPDGSFAGIASGRIDTRYFEDFYKAVELREGGAILLHLRDGTVLARYPHNDTVIGQSYADLPPFKDVLAHAQAGTVIMDSPLDGKERVLAIRALKAFPLAVNVSVDARQVLQSWLRQAWFFGTGALIACALIIWLMFLLASRSRQIETLVIEYGNAKEAAEFANTRLVEQMEERERAEAALRQAQRIEAVGRLTGGVAHDFNNLLTVVLGNIDLLSRNMLLDQTARDQLAAMRAATERGATLTAQLLAFARRQPLVPRPVDLNAAIASMQDLLKSALGSAVRIETWPAPALWPAMVDVTQIELVVLNLTINARDAMPRGGVLTIETTNARVGPPQREGEPAEGEYVAITVRDNGVGMTADVLARVFEPFFTTKPPGAGSGLGLSQVYGTARQSGGGVRIDSAPGIGTSVTVYLPRSRTAAEPPPAMPAAAPSNASQGAVLVVDDDPAVRTTTVGVLRDLGYDVREAGGGADALDLLRRDSGIEVLLTDVVMPGMNGAELARLAPGVRPHLTILFMSGYADPEEITGALQRHRLVRKPFLPADLANQIEAALADNQVVAAK